MKTIRYFITLSFLSLFLSSCAVCSIPRRLDNFVDNTELKCSGYSKADWDKSETQYNRLVNQYESSNADYSKAEKKMAARAIGRYQTLLVENGIEDTITDVKALKDVLSEYLDGMSSMMKSKSNEIEPAFERLLNDEEIKNSFNSIGDTFRRIFNNSKNGNK